MFSNQTEPNKSFIENVFKGYKVRYLSTTRTQSELFKKAMSVTALYIPGIS